MIGTCRCNRYTVRCDYVRGAIWGGGHCSSEAAVGGVLREACAKRRVTPPPCRERRLMLPLLPCWGLNVLLCAGQGGSYSIIVGRRRSSSVRYNRWECVFVRLCSVLDDLTGPKAAQTVQLFYYYSYRNNVSRR